MIQEIRVDYLTDARNLRYFVFTVTVAIHKVLIISTFDVGVEILRIERLKFVFFRVTSLNNLPIKCNITPAYPTCDIPNHSLEILFRN